jgi:hypothetical protein
MIISSRRVRLKPNAILTLPSWVRAPLSIQLNDTLYTVWESESNRSFVEITLSRFEPSHWGDMWRVEVETVDQIGFYQEVTDYLLGINFMILACEGSVVDGGRSHMMSFILSGVNYASENDKNSRKRQASDYFALRDLTEAMSVMFIDRLLFSDNGMPRLKIRRIDAYHRMWRRLDDGLKGPESLKNRSSGVKLPDQIVNDVTVCYPELSHVNSDCFYSTSVDTKDRLIRVIAFRDGAHKPFYLQIGIPGEVRFIDEVFRLLKENECNVIKFQLRRGLTPKYKNAILRNMRQDPVRMDITFTSSNLRNEARFISSISQKIMSSEHLRAVGCEVIVMDQFSD